MNTSGKILLFDGVCNLCNGLVRFIIRHDRGNVIKFSPVQSMAGCALLSQYKISAADTDTVVYISNSKIFLRSSAVLNLLRDLGGGWKLFYGFIIVPRFVRDFFYNLIAKNRYRIFGRRDICMVPEPGIREKFI